MFTICLNLYLSFFAAYSGRCAAIRRAVVRKVQIALKEVESSRFECIHGTLPGGDALPSSRGRPLGVSLPQPSQLATANWLLCRLPHCKLWLLLRGRHGRWYEERFQYSDGGVGCPQWQIKEQVKL